MNILHHNRDWDHGGPIVLMSDRWVDEHWGRAFRMLDRLSRFHNFTWVLMQKHDVELTPEDLEAPGDDPREYRGLRHNRRQVQREVEGLSAELRQLEPRVRDEYESPLSWRMTKPLRAGARRVRDRVR